MVMFLCKGRCGSRRRVLPYKDFSIRYYLCTDCKRKYGTEVKAEAVEVKTPEVRLSVRKFSMLTRRSG